MHKHAKGMATISTKQPPTVTLSPFEQKNELIKLATGHIKSTGTLLNAGRGNPNWTAATPREAFFTFGQFAVSECRRVWDEGDLAGMPKHDGIAVRFDAFVATHVSAPGIGLLQDIVDYGFYELGFDADDWVYELTDGIIGDHYPVPDRMLVHCERVVHEFLVQELCGRDRACGRFSLFAVEGATAAMCYIFESLLENELLCHGDTIAVMVPIFPPYVEIPHLSRYEFKVVEIRATGMDGQGQHTWQYPQSELDKLKDTQIKALFMVNPSNPPSVAMDPASVDRVRTIVKEHHPNLMIISDDVYSTFVDEYQSLLGILPDNTIGVYSFSKYFGVTGWRLGVIAMHESNIYDRQLRALSEEQKAGLAQRYATITPDVEKLSFLDRIVADSRQVALNHTAGLSTPQQVQMAIFSAFASLDKANRYKQRTMEICRRRMEVLYRGLGLPTPRPPYGAYYYTQFDIAEWSLVHYGSAFSQYLQDHHQASEVLYTLANKAAIVLLSGEGFRAPTWSVRVSLANLDEEAYGAIGSALHEVLADYVADWKHTLHS